MALETVAKGSFLTILIWIKLIFRKVEQDIITAWFIVSIVLLPSWGEQWEVDYENYHNILSETHLSYINWIGNGQNRGLASPFLCQEILKNPVAFFLKLQLYYQAWVSYQGYIKWLVVHQSWTTIIFVSWWRSIYELILNSQVQNGVHGALIFRVQC